MKPVTNKLSLNQETLRKLTVESASLLGTNHSLNSLCHLPCTPVIQR
jgi:hypothetical protein